MDSDARQEPSFLDGIPLAKGATGGVWNIFRTFLIRHYRGGYSLARSYWLNSSPTMLWMALLRATPDRWFESMSPAVASATCLLYLALETATWWWATKGTWVSAGKHVERGGKKIWASLVRFLLVMSGIRISFMILGIVPIAIELAEVASSSSKQIPMSFEILDGGGVMLVTTGFNDGDASLLAAAVDKRRAVHTIALSSGGGWIRESERFAQVIRERKLHTHVEDECSSACTVAFLAGVDRTMASGAVLGFHASRSIGSLSTLPTAAGTADLRRLYRRARIDETFIDKALGTPHEEIWYPDEETLIQAGVITHRLVPVTSDEQ